MEPAPQRKPLRGWFVFIGRLYRAVGRCGRYHTARAEQSPRPYGVVGVGVPDDPWSVAATAMSHGRTLCAPTNKKTPSLKLEVSLQVGVTGFEPTASWSRTKRATNCATPRKEKPQQRSCCGVVGDERIELPRAESESAALPLCESPSGISYRASALNAHIL